MVNNAEEIKSRMAMKLRSNEQLLRRQFDELFDSKGPRASGFRIGRKGEVFMEAQRGTPRVLIFSLRNIFGKALFRCPHFEFEDLICEMNSAELLAPKLDPSSARSSFAARLAYHAPIILNPGLRKISAKQQYDILFTVCGYPQDLIMFNAVSNLRDVCKTSVCLLDELWINEIVQSRHFLPILAKFDVVLLYYSQTVKPLSEIIGRECIYLPPGVDAVSFCPDPNPPRECHRRLQHRAQIGDNTPKTSQNGTGKRLILSSRQYWRE